jgi:hypothetical protein
VNNWFVFADGFSIAIGSLWARLFFVLFWIAGVVVSLNIVVATILDQFSRAVESDSQQQQHHNIDPRLLTGIDGLPSDGKAMLQVRRRARLRHQPTVDYTTDENDDDDDDDDDVDNNNNNNNNDNNSDDDDDDDGNDFEVLKEQRD